MDEYTRECLAIEVARRLRFDAVLFCLAELFVHRGVLTHIRSGNGHEFAAKTVWQWLQRVGVQTLFIVPGSPWKNGYVESFNGKLRDERLDRELVATRWEVLVMVKCWRRHYNQVRPHRPLGLRPRALETIAPQRVATLSSQISLPVIICLR